MGENHIRNTLEDIAAKYGAKSCEKLSELLPHYGITNSELFRYLDMAKQSKDVRDKKVYSLFYQAGEKLENSIRAYFISR